MSDIIKYEEVRMVESSEIDRAVESIYQLPFNYQQQNIENDIKDSFEYWIVPSGNNFHEGTNGPRLFGKPKRVKDIILYPSYNTAETIAWSWIRDNSAIRIEVVTLTLKSKL